MLDPLTIDSSNLRERRALHERYRDRLSISPILSSQMVSYRGNRNIPGLRWMKYKEGFSSTLVEKVIEELNPTSILDPFSGIGTTPLTAAARGLQATGIELLPVASSTATALALASKGVDQAAFQHAATSLLDRVRSNVQAAQHYAFLHLNITAQAFPNQTELALAKARESLAHIDDPHIRTLLTVACMSVLESVSYTRKDGQYLRWDKRSGKSSASATQKATVSSFADALIQRLEQMSEDLDSLRGSCNGPEPRFITGSCLYHLRDLPSRSFDLVLTSPPYPNRYDYTRTYALELAWLGLDDNAIKALRQTMLSATVENKSKQQWLEDLYIGTDMFDTALGLYNSQRAIHEVLMQLRSYSSHLNNPHIIRMLEGYFLEMAVIVTEFARLVRPGGTVVMVIDNVQYHGEPLPVDLILSDYAERCGFVCDHVWTLPKRKGNSSQQMGRFGRQEQRKSVNWWLRVGT